VQRRAFALETFMSAPSFVGPRVTRYCQRAVTPEVDDDTCPQTRPPSAVASPEADPWCGGEGAPEARSVEQSTRPAPQESVDSWPLAITILDAIGGTPAHRYPPSRCDRQRVTSS